MELKKLNMLENQRSRKLVYLDTLTNDLTMGFVKKEEVRDGYDVFVFCLSISLITSLSFFSSFSVGFQGLNGISSLPHRIIYWM